MQTSEAIDAVDGRDDQAGKDDRAFFSQEWVRTIVGLAAAVALAPVAGMVLFFAVIPALPIGLFVGFVCLPDHLDRILTDRRIRAERERDARVAVRRRAIEREAQIYAGESSLGGRAHA